jgi:putative ABC transport system ATP-binding protein
MSTILAVEQLSQTYRSGDRSLTVLQDVSFSITSGESLAIVGPSGSGKTTLLGLCAGLDRAGEGNVILCDALLNNLDEDARAAVRNQFVGFIFQNFQLIPTLTALENVMIPAELNGKKNAQQKAKELLNKVGLGDRMDHYPTQLSGGEQQRVALARAFCNEPKILFADEPTGNLDDSTGQMVEELMFELNKEMGTTLVIVTHDPELAAKTQRIIQLKGGHVVADTRTPQNA